MSDPDLLPEKPGAVLADWREIRKRIHKEFDDATTEQERVALLIAHKAVMDLVEGGGIHGDDLEMFRKARREDYNLLVVKECLVGENVCAETLHAVTRREIAAGRMAQDDPLAVDAAKAMAAPHYSRAQLIEQARRKNSPKPKSVAGRLVNLFRKQ